MFINACLCSLPLHVRLISSLFITVTPPSTVNGTSGCGASHRITLPSPICPGNFSVPLRSNLPILPSLRLYLSVTDRANMGKQTAGLSSNRIRDCGASAQSVSLPHLLRLNGTPHLRACRTDSRQAALDAIELYECGPE